MVKVHVVYCGGWGYKSKYNAVKKGLEKKFPGKCEISGESTKGTTGYLEVSVDDNLVHSKKNGDGYVDTEAKMEKICSAVEKALKA